MKRIWAVVAVILALVVLFSCAGKTAESAAEPEIAVNTNIPPEFGGAVLQKQLINEAEAVSDGYLLVEHTPFTTHQHIAKYDKTGNLLWKKQYSFFVQLNHSADIIICPLADDSFVFSYHFDIFQNPDKIWTTTDYILARCDKNGNLLWQYTYAYNADGFISHIYEADNGNIITLGSAGIKFNFEYLSYSPSDIFLTELTQDGELIDIVQYGGTDFDWVDEAEYVSGVGLVAIIETQSSDGDFAASRDGYGADVFVLFSDNLSIKRRKVLPESLEVFEAVIDAENVFLFDFDNNFYKVSLSGRIVRKRSIADEEFFTLLVGNSKLGQLFRVEDKLVFYKNMKKALTIPFNVGDAIKIIDTDSGFVIVSIRYGDPLPSPAYVSAIYYETELIYSGYSDAGELLWRAQYDTTPLIFYDYVPED
ncbi:MAG: hypothetical protein LBO63_04185 [Oscillospiraceae bacterium]|nr:hypothetical protein [Oscillospiraceae bacterium]